MRDEKHIAGWRKSWLTSIAEFSNIDEQRRLWLDARQQNPHSSFVEYMNTYFDDVLLGGEIQDCVEKALVTLEEAVCVREFHLLAGSYTTPQNDDYDHAAILDDPNWAAVVIAAADAKKCLLGALKEREKKFLTTVARNEP